MTPYDLLLLSDTNLANLALPEYDTMATIANVSAVLMAIGFAIWALPLAVLSLCGGGAGICIAAVFSIRLALTWLVWSASVNIAIALYPSTGWVTSAVVIALVMGLWSVVSLSLHSHAGD